MIGSSVAAELIKLRTLPAVWITSLLTVAAAVLVTAADASSSVDPAADAVTVALGSVAYLQVGSIVLGVLSVASEYGSHELRTTLTATPNRVVSLTAKAVAQLIAITATSVIALAAGLATAVLMTDEVRTSLWWVAGAAAYLVLVGLLAGAVTVVIRSLLPALGVALGGVVIASPLLGSVTDQVRWLPDQAGRALYSVDPGPFAPAGGGAVLLAWVLCIGTVAVVAFLKRDA
ncbi:hypothetical protein FB561_7289 [Kribbella amoyensis]|uniref:ABC-2 type transport system permease protein n=1 Tax=Kribbella amoyensis TaxID=996641 RepID=A0A561B3F2_9ACTN|nr:ABC transporter permease [Kribbella amoyensis]TWD73400.1 hypothetical protein FB561_7289 [Kribbella amoyensis]